MYWELARMPGDWDFSGRQGPGKPACLHFWQAIFHCGHCWNSVMREIFCDLKKSPWLGRLSLGEISIQKLGKTMRYSEFFRTSVWKRSSLRSVSRVRVLSTFCTCTTVVLRNEGRRWKRSYSDLPPWWTETALVWCVGHKQADWAVYASSEPPSPG